MASLDSAAQTRQRRQAQQTWLPGLQVWAAVSNRPASQGQASLSKTCPESSSSLSSAVQFEARNCTESSSAVKLVQANFIAQGNTHEALDNAPTCPICLTEIGKLEDKAVVNSCMHVFCVDCLTKWVARKRVCPLCKGRIQGYMYSILSEHDYKERVIPPSPERPSSPALRSALDSRWGPRAMSLLESVGASADPSQPHSSFQQRWRETAQYYFGQSSSHQLPQASSRLSTRPSHASRQRQHHQQPHSRSDVRTATGAREPRPYYFRVQQQMQAAVAGCPQSSHPSQQPAPADAAIAWRRNIYADGMYAVTAGLQSQALPMSLAATPNRARRLQEWVHRELQALLDQEDVSIVRSFVMSLATAHSLDRLQGQSSTEQQAGGQQQDAITALQPFLHDRTAHFWHELRCFAQAPYSMATYDRVVQYQRRATDNTQALEALPSEPSQTAAGWLPPSCASAAAPGSAQPAAPRAPCAPRVSADAANRSRPAAPLLHRPARVSAPQATAAAAAAAARSPVIDLTMSDDHASPSASAESDLVLLPELPEQHAAASDRTSQPAPAPRTAAQPAAQVFQGEANALHAGNAPAEHRVGHSSSCGQHQQPAGMTSSTPRPRKQRWDVTLLDLQAKQQQPQMAPAAAGAPQASAVQDASLGQAGSQHMHTLDGNSAFSQPHPAPIPDPHGNRATSPYHSKKRSSGRGQSQQRRQQHRSRSRGVDKPHKGRAQHNIHLLQSRHRHHSPEARSFTQLRQQSVERHNSLTGQDRWQMWQPNA